MNISSFFKKKIKPIDYYLNYNKCSDEGFIDFFNRKNYSSVMLFNCSSDIRYVLKDNFKGKEILWYNNFRKQSLMAYKSGLEHRSIKILTDYLVQDLVLNENDIVLDIGANNGDFLLGLSALQKNLKYYGFEPGKYEFKCLEKNVKQINQLLDTNHQVFNLALGNYKGTGTFYYDPEFGDSSLIANSKFVDEYIVDVECLGAFWRENINKKIKLMKLEAEGFEPEILEGTGDLLEHVEYVTVDVGFERGENQESTGPDVTNYLFSKNFELIRIGQYRHVFLFKKSLF
jgi:FkbM family methyltransferase